jgi:RHS repeat-associated protein
MTRDGDTAAAPASAPTPESPQSPLPSISLPKGGGSIRGIGEKFEVNAVTGTGALSIPIALSSGRDGFVPTLALTYDSGRGNGPFGLGWSVAVPAITRKTDKGLPRYADGDESDVFLLSDAEDLVPALLQSGNDWTRATRSASADGRSFRVDAYRPRVESAHARIERWTDLDDGETHWRVISRTDVTSLYGLTAETRVADPADPRRVFSWLISESYDDRGNAILYRYKAEDSSGVDSTALHEANRSDGTRGAQRYLKRISYGNRMPRREGEDLTDRHDWLFEVVLDYGEHYDEGPDGPTFVSLGDGTRPWTVRADPSSTYRAGFELRTYRLCRRILCFHQFPDELQTADCLVRATHLGYTETPTVSFLTSVVQSGYVPRADGTYLERSFPPVELEYTPSALHTNVQEVDAESLANFPAGSDADGYAWVDLDGDGVAGILAERPDGWLYKRNLTPASDAVRLAPVEEVATGPVGAAPPAWSWLDLGGDGQPDLVRLRRSEPGYYERQPDGGWERFAPFVSAPGAPWETGDVTLVDLTGDGRADLLVTADDALTWHASQGEAGFAPAVAVPNAVDEELGPRLVLADASQSVYLADLSGDGLSDLVRVRNGEVCYWPNLGYGRFGAKVTMDGSPWFDAPDRFDPRRLRFADVDGSGPSDLLYLGDAGVQLYVNQSGNACAEPALIQTFPLVDRPEDVQTTDLLGNGTSCLVWSSALPGESGRQLRYVDLMGGQKPHLLTSIANNLGAVTRITYAASTRFALEDDLAGRPWSTRLPFPVQVVERVEVFDYVGRSRFVTRYAYHHGSFDGFEREFRGFGLVEQWDTEEHLADTAFPDDEALNWVELSWAPPVLTRTWFHSGAFLEAATVSRQHAHEYWVEPALRPDDRAEDRAAMQLGDSVLPEGLPPDEVQEAYRALKGSALRVEVFGEDGSPLAEHPYSVTEQSFAAKRLQPTAGNRHAVFLTHSRETLSFHYERQPNDPRVTHELTLEVDRHGDVLRSASVAYPRRGGGPEPEPQLASAFREMLASDQSRLHVVASDHRFTNAVDDPAAFPDAHRTPLLAEAITAELTGLAPSVNRTGITNLLRFAELDAHWHAAWDGTHDVPHEEVPAADVDGGDVPATALTRRILSHTRVLFLEDDLATLLPLGKLQPRALAGESYRLVLTATLISRLLGARVSDATLLEAGFVQLPGGSDWWLPSGRVHFSPGDGDTPAQELAHASAHFFHPRRFVDPFGATSRIALDEYDLLPASVVDEVGNTTTARNDYRVLAPVELTDANGNRAQVALDALGVVVAQAVLGKTTQSLGDSLAGVVADLNEPVALAALADPLASTGAMLGTATSRSIYDIFAFYRTRNDPAPAPAVVYTVARDTHVSDLWPGGTTRYQHTFAYSDGLGHEIQRKTLAEPGPVSAGGPNVSRRWVGSGWVILNNKGKPVRQYEPFFSTTHRFEFAQQVGVSTVLLYDVASRVVATLHPDSSWSKTVFAAWQQEIWDSNDTVAIADPRLDSDVGAAFRRLLGDAPGAYKSWHDRRIGGTLGSTPGEQAAQKDAAEKAAAHAATPGAVHFDSLGRNCLTVVENGASGRYATRVATDAAGRPLVAFDPLGRRVVEHCLREQEQGGGFRYVAGYDVAGRELYWKGMDGGERRTLQDAASKTIRAWDARDQAFRMGYDALHRPTHRYVTVSGAPEVLLERTVYGEGFPDRNLCGKPFRRYDGVGVAVNERYDFKGNLVESTRQLALEYRGSVDWSATATIEDAGALDQATAGLLDAADVFRATTLFDALNRPLQVVAPHSPTMRPSVLRPFYNEAALLERVDVWINQPSAPASPLDPQTADLHAIADVDYDARGRRTRLGLGNGTVSEYVFDSESLRLARVTTTRPASFSADERVVQDLAYAYDPIGNVTRIDDAADIHDVVFFKNRRVDPSADFRYDAAYRLVRATGREHLGQNAGGLGPPVQVSSDDGPRVGLLQPGDGNAMGTYTETYAYDAAGNITELLHQVVSGSWRMRYAYAEASAVTAAETSNRLSATSIPGDPDGGPYSATYAYDAHGNTVQMPHLPTLAWDERDRLRSTARQLVGPGKTPETTHYAYDGGGERLRTVTERQAEAGEQPTRMKQRLYLGPVEVYREYGPDGKAVTLERETFHVSAGEQGVALVETRTLGSDPSPAQLVRYQFGNQLDSVALELDDQSQLVSYEEYFPYGGSSYQSVRSQTQTPKSYRYTGKERDDGSGFYYHRARYYAPWLGRWTSPDPIGTSGGLNLYAYVHGNPVGFRDPGGTQDEAVSPHDRAIKQMTDPQLYRHLKSLSPVKRAEFANAANGAFAGRAWAMLNKYSMEIGYQLPADEIHGKPPPPPEKHADAPGVGSSGPHPSDEELREHAPVFAFFFTVPTPYFRPYQPPPQGAPVGLDAIRQLTGQPAVGVANFSRDFAPGTHVRNLTLYAVTAIQGGVSALTPLAKAAAVSANAVELATQGAEAGSNTAPRVIEVVKDDFSIQARVPGDPKAWARLEIAGDVAKVTDVFRGGLPKGGGSELVAAAMKEAAVTSGGKLVFSNITNEATRAVFEAGGNPAMSVLGKTGTRALAMLGLEPASFAFEQVAGKLNLVIQIK